MLSRSRLDPPRGDFDLLAPLAEADSLVLDWTPVMRLRSLMRIEGGPCSLFLAAADMGYSADPPPKDSREEGRLRAVAATEISG